MKKIVVLMSVVMVVLCICFVAFAETNEFEEDEQAILLSYSGKCGTNIYWKLDDNLLEINGNGVMTDYSDKDAPWYNVRSEIMRISISDGIENIGSYAFKDCNYITSISLPDSIKRIGTCAFKECSRLETINAPDGIYSIGEEAFYNTAWYNSRSGMLYVGKTAYKYKGSLVGSIPLKDDTLGIADGAFKGCSRLTSITIPDSVMNIGSFAFHGCFNLRTIIIPNGVEKIKQYTFYGCEALESICIPSSVTEIETNALYGDIVIYSEKGSYAESYARKKGQKFVEIKNVTITFDANGGKDAPDQQIKSSLDSIVYISNKIPSRSGYDFVDWLGNDGDIYLPGGMYTGLTDIVLTAQWKRTNSTAKAFFVFGNSTGRAGDTVVIPLYLESSELVNSIGITNITFDLEHLDFIGFSDYEKINEISLFSPTFDSDYMTIVIALSDSCAFNEKVCDLNFRIKDEVEEGVFEIKADSLVKNGSNVIDSVVISGNITVLAQILGDINEDETVDIEDAAALFRYSMFPDVYPIKYKGNVDFNNDGLIDINDAAALFRYSMFPDIYTISDFSNGPNKIFRP